MERSLSKQGCAAVSLARILSCKKINLDFERIFKGFKICEGVKSNHFSKHKSRFDLIQIKIYMLQYIRKNPKIFFITVFHFSTNTFRVSTEMIWLNPAKVGRKLFVTFRIFENLDLDAFQDLALRLIVASPAPPSHRGHDGFVVAVGVSVEVRAW